MSVLIRSRMHRVLPIVCLAMISRVYSHPTGIASPSRPTALRERQELPTATSSIIWWPYPSWSEWGQPTSTLNTNNQASALTSLIPASADGVTATTPMLDASVTQTTIVVSTAMAEVSSNSSASLIRITALPPASSESSITRARSRAAKKGGDSFNIVYLAPLFGILGALAGALCTWLAYRHLPARGRSRSRGSVLVSGPPYTPPSRFRRAAPTSERPLIQEDGGARPSESSAHAFLTANPTEAKDKGSWLGRAFSSSSKAPSVPPKEVTDVSEDDPFLDNSSQAGTPALARRGTTASAHSCQVTSPDPYGATSDHEDVAAYESVRHKSIRRSILERLQFGSLRRPQLDSSPGFGYQIDGNEGSATVRSVQHRRGHKRIDSDAHVGSSMDVDETSTPSRRPSLYRGRSTMVTSPSGFRILIEDPESGALLEEDEVYTPQASPNPRATKHRQCSDKFTPAPVRRSTEEKRSSPFSSPSKPKARPAQHPMAIPSSPSVSQPAYGSAAAFGGMTRVDSSVLPMSPPMVMSPPLECQLFFGSTTSLNLQLSAPGAKAASPPRVPMSTMAEREEQQHNKLKTQRSPPPLPFPSTSKSSPFRGRLKKSPTKKPQPLPVVFPHTGRSDSSSSADSSYSVTSGSGVNRTDTNTSGMCKTGHGTPAERYHARKTALSRVEEIVSRSWSERQLAGEAFPGSPNNFGAEIPVARSGENLKDEEALMGTGIEQRLTALKR